MQRPWGPSTVRLRLTADGWRRLNEIDEDTPPNPLLQLLIYLSDGQMETQGGLLTLLIGFIRERAAARPTLPALVELAHAPFEWISLAENDNLIVKVTGNWAEGGEGTCRPCRQNTRLCF